MKALQKLDKKAYGFNRGMNIDKFEYSFSGESFGWLLGCSLDIQKVE